MPPRSGRRAEALPNSTQMSLRATDHDIFVELGDKAEDLPVEPARQILSAARISGQLAAGRAGDDAGGDHPHISHADLMVA